MAAYGYIVRKFIRDGEVPPEKFVGTSTQTIVAGTTLALFSDNCSGRVVAVLGVPSEAGASSTFNVTVPYKIRVLPDSHFVNAAVTANNVTVAIGKAAPIAGATAISSSTAAAFGSANLVTRMTSHVSAAETVNPFATDAERLTITVTRTAGQNTAGVLYLAFARAD